MAKKCWTTTELASKIDEFHDELVRAGLAESSIQTYVERSYTFVRWLDGRYKPRGPNRKSRF
jgi:hypothetical protein